MTTKMTKRDYFNELLAIADVQSNEALVNFIEHELDLLDKKNGSKKPTKTQEHNEVLKTLIVDHMEENHLYTVSELIKSISGLEEYSTQKISPLMTALAKDGKVERVEDKRKAFYRVIR